MNTARVFSRLFCITLLVAGSANAQNLLINGSFEEPAFGADSVNNPSTIPGWTSTPAPFEVWNQFQGPGADGNQYLELDVSGCTTISQSITTSATQNYLVSLAYGARVGVADNRIEVLWNGAVIGTASADGSDESGNIVWTRYGFRVQGASGSSTLAIRNVDTCDGLGSMVDDVSVVEAAPPVSVPTLSSYGVALLAASFMPLAIIFLRRRVVREQQ
jgi:Protein of unknown function (DUF642)